MTSTAITTIINGSKMGGKPSILSEKITKNTPKPTNHIVITNDNDKTKKTTNLTSRHPQSTSMLLKPQLRQTSKNRMTTKTTRLHEYQK
jgi:hypothetical protein